LNIIDRKISELLPAEYNPRRLTEKQSEDLSRSIEAFGEMEPAIINMHPGRENVIISGHQRIKVAESLHYETWPCIEVNLDPERERELNIRMNKNTGEWDWETLFKEFDTSDLVDWGFTESDFPDVIDGMEGDEHNGDQDSVPDPPKHPKTKPGDIYILGNHRLLCGDCTNIQHLEDLMEGETVGMLLTDPPYGADYGEKNRKLNKNDGGKRIESTILNDNIEDYRQFFTDFLSIIPMSEYNTCYIFMFGIQLHNLRLAFDDCGFHWSDYLVWLKNNHVLGRKDYNSKHEFAMYGWKGQHKFYGGHPYTILEFDKPQKNELHPTMKPIELLERLIQDGSQKGNVIYDAFGGSGSTMIAAEKTVRKCRMIEIDPIYCDVIIKRWEEYTGEKAKLKEK